MVEWREGRTRGRRPEGVGEEARRERGETVHSDGVGEGGHEEEEAGGWGEEETQEGEGGGEEEECGQ